MVNRQAVKSHLYGANNFCNLYSRDHVIKSMQRETISFEMLSEARACQVPDPPKCVEQ